MIGTLKKPSFRWRGGSMGRYARGVSASSLEKSARKFGGAQPWRERNDFAKLPLAQHGRGKPR